MLVDSATITVIAGSGGDGIVSWRREKSVAKGGPDGGDGGKGGDVYLRSTDNLDTLSSFRHRQIFRAVSGEHGRSKKRTGASGDDLELLVPTGTVIINEDTGERLADLAKTGEKVLIAKGGRGGLGNPHFASSTHQNPFESIKGEPGEKLVIRLELNLVSDAALIGKPNSGKSSLLNALTNANSRVASFAFSTVEPILGVAHYQHQKITFVDLPGLIADAHKGKGMGDKFLKHLQRVRLIVHVVDPTQPNYQQSVIEINQELALYSAKLAKLRQLLVFNKSDLLTEKEKATLLKEYKGALIVSALKGENLDRLMEGVSSELAQSDA